MKVFFPLSQSSQISITKQQKNAKHRMFVLKQWLQTQITYNEDLFAAIQNIKKPLKAQKLISEDDIVRLFPQFQQMLNLSTNMIKILQTFKQIKNINDLMIGKQLKGIINFYKIYLVYFKGQTKMKKILQDLQAKNQHKMRSIQTKLKQYFKDMYKNKEKNPKQNITIQDCLQRPLYRLFKYHLLIESYLKKLEENSPDYQQLKKCRQLFMKIQQQCNDSYTQMEKQQFKIKLQKIYGRGIPQNSRYITTMNASTLYFPCKLYIFSNLIVISKAQTMIGYRQEKLYLNMSLDQFSFVAYKKDTKYFKNILTLCGIYDCVHFFSSDKGTRLQIFQSVNKIITDQKLKALSKRQHRQAQPKGKLTFLMDAKNNSGTPMLPGFKIQVVDIDIRTLSYFSNDSVYIVRFSIPEYMDDEATYMKNAKLKIKAKISLDGRGSLTKQQHLLMQKHEPLPFKCFEKDSSQFMRSQNYNSLNQYVQIHLDQVIELHKTLSSQYPSIRFPEIDPLSKDINFYSENKKKTKSFEVRTFLIDQFFNFIFRHPQIMAYPMEIIKKLRIQQNLWQYVVDRNDYLLGVSSKKQSDDQGNKYNQFHCELCKKSSISSLQQFQSYRVNRIKAIFKQKQKFCFNFYNLLRNNFLGLNHGDFNNLQRILLYMNYFQGRFDYAFLYKKQIAARHKNVKIMIASLDQSHRDNQKNIFFKEGVIKADHKSTVGMLINQIARDIQVYNMLDFRIVLTSSESERILDQDQFLYDVIQSSSIQFNQGVSQVGSVVRNSELKEDTFQQQEVSFFTKLKNMMPTIINKEKPLLFLRKIVFLALPLEIQALKNSSQRAEIVIYEIFSKISQLKISLTLNIWGQLCGLYYCVRIKNQISKFTKDNIKQFSKISVELLPKQKSDYIKNKIFAQSALKIISNFQKDHEKYLNPLDYKFRLYRSILQRSYQHCMVNTYFVPVQAKLVPAQIIIDGKLKLQGPCYLGVNDNQVIVIRSKQDMAPAVCIKIEQIQIVHSAYSVFLTYKRLSRLTFNEKDTQKNEVQQFDLRFDAKMLHGFVELFEKYRLTKLKFGNMQFSQMIF